MVCSECVYMGNRNLLHIGIAASSLLGMLYVLFFNNYSISPLMPLLPFSFVIVVFFLFVREQHFFSSIVINVVVISWFVRFVIVPFFYVLSGNANPFYTNAGEENLSIATLLSIYEMFIVLLFLLLSKKVGNLVKQNILQNNDEYSSSIGRVNNITVMFVVILFVVACWCVYKDNTVLYSITSIFFKFSGDISANNLRRSILLSFKGAGSLPYRLFEFVFYYIQALLPACLLSYVINRGGNHRKRSIVLAVIVIALSSIITTDTNRDTIFIILACVVVLYFEYKSSLQSMVVPASILLTVFFVSFLFAKSNVSISEEDVIQKCSKIFNTYFVSVNSISASFEMDIQDRVLTLFGDVVSGIPFLSYFIPGLPTSVSLFNQVVWGSSDRVNYIIPLISSGYQYLLVFAPALTIITYIISLSLEIKYWNTNICFNKVLYAIMMINLAIAPCMVSLSSIIHRCCMYIPIIIICYYNDKMNVDIEYNNI